jgi:hypothetical protein
MPTLLAGAASVLDLGGTFVHDLRFVKTKSPRTYADSVRADWTVVCGDFRAAFDEVVSTRK